MRGKFSRSERQKRSVCMVENNQGANMQRTKDLTKNAVDIATNIARYTLYFLIVVIVPLIAEPLATQFDWCKLKWSEPGELHPFFAELFTIILWLLILAIITTVQGHFQKSFNAKKEKLSQKSGNATGMEGEQPAIEKLKVCTKEERKALRKLRSEKHKKAFRDWKQANFSPKTILSWKNIGWVMLITSACILLISAQIDFQVKPFYELGDKITYSEIFNKGGEIVLNIVKCVWIVMMLRAALKLWTALLEFWNISRVRFLKWIGAGAMLVLFGAYDVFATGNPFAWTYIAYYVAFTALYYFTERSEVKTYLLTFFIYIF